MSMKMYEEGNWPPFRGDYLVGSPKSRIAVVTLASNLHIEGAAISGSCKTENLGVEKIVANIISNSNIRFLLICGAESKGHLPGDSISCRREFWNHVRPAEIQTLGHWWRWRSPRHRILSPFRIWKKEPEDQDARPGQGWRHTGHALCWRRRIRRSEKKGQGNDPARLGGWEDQPGESKRNLWMERMRKTWFKGSRFQVV